MKVPFYKYQGTGNDFIMIDNRDEKFSGLTEAQIQKICQRRFGVGADGLILLENSVEHDFKMVYFNSDGRQSSMCGNGGRCILQFVHDLGMTQENYAFTAIDGLHHGVVDRDEVCLEMKNVEGVELFENGDLFLDTGSPHHIVFRDTLPGDEFIKSAKEIRHNKRYDAQGVNVNFVKASGKQLEMRTFERGVENETLSCGTGVTAAAISAYHSGNISGNIINVKTAGGNLQVKFKANGSGYSDIWLIGPATRVFEGEIDV